MVIIANRTTIYGQGWKGLPYGKTSIHDQISAGSGKASPTNRSRGSAEIFRHAQSTRLFSGPAFYSFASSAVLQHGLSWYRRAVTRAQTNQKRFGPDQDTALYNSAKGSAKDVKKNIFQGLLGKIFEQAAACRLIKHSSAHTCCIDSTGLENQYVSRHFLQSCLR